MIDDRGFFSSDDKQVRMDIRKIEIGKKKRERYFPIYRYFRSGFGNKQLLPGNVGFRAANSSSVSQSGCGSSHKKTHTVFVVAESYNFK
jgi:hypothetical protein